MKNTLQATFIGAIAAMIIFASLTMFSNCYQEHRDLGFSAMSSWMSCSS